MRQLLMLLLLLITFSVNSQTKSCWPVFRGDPALTGVTQSALPADPEILWTFASGDQFKSSPVVCKGTIVVASMDGILYAVNMQGQKVWTYTSESGFEAPATMHGAYVYVGDLGGSVHCLDLKNGEEKWQYKTDGQIMGSPVVYTWQGKTTLMFGSYDYFLYALDPESGKLLWKYESDNYINGAPACLNGEVIFGGCDGFLHVIGVPDGKLREKVEVATYVAGSSALEDKMAYTGDYDGRFSAIDLAHKSIKWRWEDATKNLAFIASPALSGKTVIAGCRDKFLYCFNKSDGSVIWKYNTGSRVDASPVISGSKVLAANMRGDVLILDLNNGKVLTSYELGSAISGTPAVVDGKILVAAEDGNLYCLGEK
ncbi:PQQ-binding-like beta-propeller repeat protein [Saccharicrinis sp. FJH54]|uniref:beta-alanine-activating enzyme beta-propeller domain-containing protein n=1 Tax=Saccharicrinis sp. FJH54 TaxID=3344665 RepID=UPI0035D49D34